jgi:hypothetical protein
MPDGKIQLRIDEPLDSRFTVELPAVRLQQGLFDFCRTSSPLGATGRILASPKTVPA